MIFDYHNITEYQIEVTTYCNASCPQCPRNVQGSRINPWLPLTSLPRELLAARFPAELCQRLRQIFFCGSYGDPIMHKEFLGILEDFRNKSKTLWLYLHTNGGAHDEAWWRQLAIVLDGHGQVDFGIDGIGPTLSLYRRHVDYQKVINNARAFIQAGGRAKWNFIVFRHNEHEVDAARALAQEFGFVDFLARRTGRFWHHEQEREIDQWPVLDRQGHVEYVLEPPQNPEWRNASTQRIEFIRSEHASFAKYLAGTSITCDAAQGRKVAIAATGLVMPCNFFTHNLYDARFRDPEYLPGRHPLSQQNNINQVAAFVDRHGRDGLDLHYHSLEQIFASPFWQELEHSWYGQDRLMECAMTCGEKFTKVWDQGGNKQ